MIQRWIQSVFAEEGLTIWPVMALAIFFFLFLAMAVWVFRRGSSELYRRQANLPLEDGHADHPSSQDSGQEVHHGNRA